MPLKQPPLPYQQDYYTGQYSYLNNSRNYGSGASDTAAMFPAGWGQPGETPEDAIWKNAVEGNWLPLWLPSGADGYIGNGLPEIIFYAANTFKTHLDSYVGTDPDARYQRACEAALEAASSTSGATHLVREAG